jgi:hypothetical protein
MIAFASQRLLELEVERLTGAGMARRATRDCPTRRWLVG